MFLLQNKTSIGAWLDEPLALERRKHNLQKDSSDQEDRQSDRQTVPPAMRDMWTDPPEMAACADGAAGAVEKSPPQSSTFDA
ncbi:UNVERIFIED_CONTAM: hypothetical protein K2H54_031986 [Gekko kuhli]